jgi:hypothetical protein
MAKYRQNFQYDDALNLKDAADVTSTAAGSLVVDLGDGFFDGYLVIDVTALEVASTDEKYTIVLEGSNVAALASGSVVLAAAPMMGNSVAPADADTAVGRFAVPVTNEQNGELYRYVRVHTTVAGTIDTTGINYSAFLAKRA